MQLKERKKYCVRYNSDPTLVTDNHKSDIMFLLDVDERNFDSRPDAITFLLECTSPITTIRDLVPELNGMRDVKNLPFILPEEHIKPKHTLIADMGEIFANQKLWQ